MFGLEFNHESLMTFFSQYAYQPYSVYGFIVVFMFLSSFGFPVPEELILVTSGLVAYMAHHPDKFPPPFEGAQGVNVITLSVVCFLAVLTSDVIVYLLGKYFGTKIVNTHFFKKKIAGKGFDTVNYWFQKYGGYACGIFRFTPGLRFPGHMSCGLLGISLWKFLAIDGLAAALSVPTQVYFVSKYGEIILDKLAEFKLYLGIAFLVFLIILGIRKILSRKSQTQAL